MIHPKIFQFQFIKEFFKNKYLHILLFLILNQLIVFHIVLLIFLEFLQEVALNYIYIYIYIYIFFK
jgi:hypothetical protein